MRQLSKPVEGSTDATLLIPPQPPLLCSVRKISAEDSPVVMMAPSTGSSSDRVVRVLMIGTGEYTTGFVNGQASDSDKGAGVVALTLMDLQLRGKTGSLGLCGVNGTKFPGIRAHLREAIANKYPQSHFQPCIDALHCFPADTEINPEAYVQALDCYQPGDAAIVFTPDDTHFAIALECVRRGLHVLVTKPVVKTLAQHLELQREAAQHNVLVCVEVHKRWDPIYADARDRIQAMGPFSFLHAYMSQPKHQLETFKAWAGKSSDISYYLNSHHVDFHEWCVGNSSRPLSVTACASTGVARGNFGLDCEDTITLTVQWENLAAGNEPAQEPSLGTAVYTSSWVAPRSDVHSQQRFFYMGHAGEVNVDQAHRGYNTADDQQGYRSVNPLFMKYIPTEGKFSGQGGYGYRSVEAFVDACAALGRGQSVRHFDHSLASIHTTARTTAILEAGRRSLDEKRAIEICYANEADPCSPTFLR